MHRTPRHTQPPPISRAWLATLLVYMACMFGCATIRPAYTTGKTVRELTDEAHGVYSSNLNARASHCDPKTNPAVKYQEDYDECMGPAFNAATAEKVAVAYTAYKAAAEALTAVLLHESSTPAQRYEAWARVVSSAISLVELFPDAEATLTKIVAVMEGRAR